MSYVFNTLRVSLPVLMLLLMFSPVALAASSVVAEPFGSDLFKGNFSQGTFDELNPEYVIVPGDRVAVRVWGAKSQEGVLDVDAQGNIFLPEIGPIRVGGIRHGDLGKIVRGRVQSVYASNVEVYTNLLNPQPVAVFVAGFVGKPGRYAGGASDSVLYYLDLAGGIDPDRGSYRNVKIVRDGKLIEQIDLYPFIFEGKIERPRLAEGDVILVDGRGAGITTGGEARHHARFEFPQDQAIPGKELLLFAHPQSKVSHVSIIGTRDGAPFNTYVPLNEFAAVELKDGDRVEFHADTPGQTIMVSARGAIVGASRYPVSKTTRLKALLEQIPLEEELANRQGIHILRRSVAEQQRKALRDALVRLEQSSLKATSASVDEANIRVREAELIAKFVEKAKEVQPDGTVVVGRNGELQDLYLEDGDVVVVPTKSDVVVISGEVLIPQAVVFDGERDFEEYIEGAGGYSDRADRKNILIVKPNGEVLAAKGADIAAGDQLLVLPKVDTKSLQLVKDISQILYQIAVAAKVALTI